MNGKNTHDVLKDLARQVMRTFYWEHGDKPEHNGARFIVASELLNHDEYVETETVAKRTRLPIALVKAALNQLSTLKVCSVFCCVCFCCFVFVPHKGRKVCAKGSLSAIQG